MSSSGAEGLSAVMESSESSCDSGFKSFSRSPSLTSIDRWPIFFTAARRSRPERKLPKHRDPVLIERRNLVNISKLIVKELIENSLKNGRMLDSDHAPLQHFFIVLEHVLRHGLRPKKGLLGPKKELWDILQIVEKLTPDAQELANSIRDLPTVKTQMGRARAWLRVALMQKKLADYLKVLVDNRDEELVDYFEPDALMMSDEAIVIVGLMVGLNVIDCNLCIKEEDLDSQQGVIDFSLYLRSSHLPNHHVQGTVSCPDSPLGLETENMNVVLDQKNYIEELNCHLKATVANLESKVETLTTSNTLIKEELDMSKSSLTTLKEENEMLKKQLIQQDSSKDSEFVTVDIPSGDTDTLKQFAENEKKQRIEAEKELHLQMSLKAEMEVAMKLLEKESREKQENIVSLRKQLDDIKMINLEMYKKLQECEDDLTKKAEMVSRLQKKTEQIGCLLSNLQFHDAQQLRMQRNSVGMKSSNSDTKLASRPDRSHHRQSYTPILPANAPSPEPLTDPEQTTEP